MKNDENFGGLMVEEVYQMMVSGARHTGMREAMAASYGSSTSTTSTPTGTLSLKTMLDAMEKLKADQVDMDPVGTFMRSHGYEPKDGDLLFVPESMAGMFGPWPPAYVVSSPFVLYPCLVRGHMLHPEPIKRLPLYNLGDLQC